MHAKKIKQKVIKYHFHFTICGVLLSGRLTSSLVVCVVGTD